MSKLENKGEIYLFLGNLYGKKPHLERIGMCKNQKHFLFLSSLYSTLQHSKVLRAVSLKNQDYI